MPEPPASSFDETLLECCTLKINGKPGVTLAKTVKVKMLSMEVLAVTFVCAYLK